MIVISYGMTKSASSFAWLALKEILRRGGARPIDLSSLTRNADSAIDFVDPVDESRLKLVEIEAGGRSAAIKTHGAATDYVPKLLARRPATVFVSHRDPRDIALSLIDHGARSRARGGRDFAECVDFDSAAPMVAEQVDRLSTWIAMGDVTPIDYDAISFDTEATLAMMAARLDLRVSAKEVAAHFADKTKIPQFNKGAPRRWESEMPAEVSAAYRERFHLYYDWRDTL